MKGESKKTKADPDTYYSQERASSAKRKLIQIFSRANNLLREEGIREGIDRFTDFSYLLFFKLISEMEEDKGKNGKKNYLHKEYCWESFCHKDAEAMLDCVNSVVLPGFAERYNHGGDLFHGKLKISNPKNLKEIVTELSLLKLLDAESDVKGDAFEFFLKNSVSVGNDFGEYFTPRHIVKLIIDLVNPQFREKIYDPCCGTGGFLIEAFRHIWCGRGASEISCISEKADMPTEPYHICDETIFSGREISETAKVAKMNMIIMGGDSSHIFQTDSLKNPVKNEFDVVLTNFPFSQKTRYGHFYDLPTHDANPVFLKHVIDALKPGGRAGVVVPDGLLFDKNAEYVKVRKVLLETCNLAAVIQLDPFVFKPYTGQPTSILIFKKGGYTKKVWFFDLVNDGFKKTNSKKGRPAVRESDLPLLKSMWPGKEKSKQSFSVDMGRIEQNNYTLTMNTYKKKIQRQVPVKTLGELCELPVIGSTPPRNNPACWKGNHLWVKISDMGPMYIHDTEEKISDKGIIMSAVKKLTRGTLLFSFKLTIGKVGIARKDLYTNEAVAGLVPRDKKDPGLIRYLYYILPSIDYTPYAQRATKGYTLNAGSICDIEVPYPEKTIREKIIKECDKKEKKKNSLLLKINEIENEKFNFIMEHTK